MIMTRDAFSVNEVAYSGAVCSVPKLNKLTLKKLRMEVKSDVLLSESITRAGNIERQ